MTASRLPLGSCPTVGGSALVLLGSLLLAAHLGGIPLQSPILALDPRRWVRRLSLATFLSALLYSVVGGVTGALLGALVATRAAAAVSPAWTRRRDAAAA